MENNINQQQCIDTEATPLHPKLELPIYGLPQGFQQYIDSYATVYSCPREFITAALFTAVSTITGTRVQITDGIYRNFLSLWWVNIAPSGSNKTHPVKMVMKSLADIDSMMYKQYREDLAKWKADDDQVTEKPRYRTILVGDMTEESRHSILNDNKNGVCGYYPEIKGFFDDLDRYNKSGSTSRVLRLWDNDSIKVTRKGDPEPIVIEKPFMNILGDLQPSMLKSTFGNETFIFSGLTQRFLFCYPENIEYPERKRMCIDSMTESYLAQRLKSLKNNTYLDGSPIITTDTIQLSIEADTIYNDYYNKLQKLKEEAADDYISSIYSKAQIQVMRLAGITHMVKALEPDESFDFAVVYDTTMQYAVDCMEYFVKCALKVYEQIKPSHKLQSGKKSKTDVMREFAKVYPIKHMNLFAISIDKERTYVSKILHTTP